MYPTVMAEQVRDSRAPRLVVLDESTKDQLVPMNQRERLEAKLDEVEGLQLTRGHQCTGSHAAPWEQGVMIWDSIRDVLGLLQKKNR